MNEEGGARGVSASPKIELHVHLEGTIRAPTLLEIARRNDVSLPASTVAGLRELYRFQDFDHFIETSNVRTKAVSSLDAHPLPHLIAAGVSCTVSTDDPAMFDTDLGREYDLVRSMGIDIAGAYHAGVQGALCDEATRERLTAIGQSASWADDGHRDAGGSDGGGASVNGPA